MEDHVRVVANEFVCSSYASLNVEQLLLVACRVGFAFLLHDCAPLFFAVIMMCFFHVAAAPNRSFTTRLVESDAHAHTRAAVPLKSFELNDAKACLCTTRRDCTRLSRHSVLLSGQTFLVRVGMRDSWRDMLCALEGQCATCMMNSRKLFTSSIEC